VSRRFILDVWFSFSNQRYLIWQNQ
jgi:hypothetical protein